MNTDFQGSVCNELIYLSYLVLGIYGTIFPITLKTSKQNQNSKNDLRNEILNSDLENRYNLNFGLRS